MVVELKSIDLVAGVLVILGLLAIAATIYIFCFGGGVKAEKRKPSEQQLYTYF